MPLKASYLALTGIGGIVAYAGWRGYGIGGTLRDIVTGQNPQQQAQTQAILSAAYNSPFSSNAYAGGAGIAQIAQSMIGFPYSWGAAPNSGATDCSGLVNEIVGAKAGRAIPGYKAGSYTGATHGPNTTMWLASIGSVVNRVKRSQAEPGDIACWLTHMGIVVGPNQLVSDLNPSEGTQQTQINGLIPFEPLFILRLK